MANQKVSQLTAATTPLAGTETAYVVQSGSSRKTTVAAIAATAPGTDLTYTAATRTLVSSTGADVVLPVATTTDAGLESAADKTKLDSITVDRATLTVSLVRNTTGSSIAKGTPVYVTGSSGVTKLVAPADASLEATAANTLGVTQEAIAHNSTGYVVTEGELSGIDTSALTEGALIFLSETTGAMTSTRPTQPAHGVVLGWCIKTGAGSSGIIYVKVDNGLELNELHDVLITSPVTGQVLRRASDGLWKNAALVASDVAGLSGTNTGDVTLAASVTDVLSLSGQELQADDPGADRLLFWDDSASKLTHLTLGTGLTITGTTIDAAGGVSDGDKGDITVSASGGTWTIDAGAVTYAKLQDVSATDRILGRSTAGAGDVEEITCTAAGRALLDDADAAAQRTTLSAAGSGAITGSGLTMATARLLGRSTASTGAVEEISLAGGLAFSSGTLTVPVEIGLACSDETTALTTGTAKVTFRMPYAMTVTAVRSSVTTAPTGSTLVVDINEGGTSILSTKLSIDATEKTSTTAATAAVISDTALADDAEITIDIDQIGSTVAGAGLKVWIIGRRA
jgi:hypothetical protein